MEYSTFSPLLEPKNHLLFWICWLSYCPLLRFSYLFISVSIVDKLNYFRPLLLFRGEFSRIFLTIPLLYLIQTMLIQSSLNAISDLAVIDYLKWIVIADYFLSYGSMSSLSYACLRILSVSSLKMDAVITFSIYIR